jgi:hypothetical protein
LVVRTDGNNFIAEMAAAAVVIKACPTQMPLTLRIDSMATIGALSKGVISERRRIRASGRAWVNLCRSASIQKGSYLRIEHVRSHTGCLSPSQIGNEKADQIANKFRLQGQKEPPASYLSSTEEEFFLVHNSTRVQGDPRTFLKRLETMYMINSWKTNSETQAQWYLRFPTQIIKQARRVWKWAITSGIGDSWIFFIFAVCQWLPTNHRLYYNSSDPVASKCKLCLRNESENMEHILICPALAEEHFQLKSEITKKLVDLKIPYGSRNFTREHKLRGRWYNAAQEAFPNVFPSPRLHFLTKGFWLTNQNKQFISTRKFLDGLSQIVNATAVFTPREDLLTILIGELCLQSHSGTDALRVSPLFHDWSSTRPSDSLFGALLIDENYDFSGLSSFFCSTNDDVKIWLERFVKALEAKTPTRFVCLVPS